MHLTNKVIEFILLIKQNKGKITKDEQKFFDSVRYYVMINYLYKNGLIYCDGVNNENNQKIWKFTEKGTKLAMLLEEIKNLLGGS